ncbi:MAG: glycosyltransferase family 2 protein [Polyangiaceae bacterium]|nr:glycosyltransferase family 2 protein [Polyangiaceae bacterium]
MEKRGSTDERPDLAVVILTYNEEDNIAQALGSVCGWARQVFVLDSWSSDRTLEIANQFDCIVQQNKFEDYGRQRNHALDALPITTQWIFFLDADEWIPSDLRREITDVLARSPRENGFLVKYRMMWMGRWIKRGYYPTWLLRLFRRGKARCERRSVNEHLILEGEAGRLENDFIHEDRKSLSRWIQKHDAYAEREPAELFKEPEGYIDASLFGTQAERKRWVRYKVWNRLPPLVRPVAYFWYRYFLRGGILDGREGFVFHALQAFWFPLLIDAKYLEMKRRRERG